MDSSTGELPDRTVADHHLLNRDLDLVAVAQDAGGASLQAQ
jgi:hypothetical protein